MTPAQRHRRAIQERILDDVKASTRATDSEIAGWAGIDRTLVSRWRNGEREMGLMELLGIVRGAGDARPVLQPLADAGDCDVVRRSTVPDGDPYGAVMRAMGNAGSLVRELATAIQDGRIDETERHALLGAIDQHVAPAGHLCKRDNRRHPFHAARVQE